MVSRLNTDTAPLADAVGPVEACCEIGDITISHVDGAFLIGRVIAPKGPGNWWEPIATVTLEVDAVYHAQTLARQYGTRAWRHVGGDEYESVSRNYRE